MNQDAAPLAEPTPQGDAGAPDVGFSLLRRSGPQRYRKVLITGAGRSGTTAVAAIFDCLGFHLGDEPVPQLHEDLALRRLMLKDDAPALAQQLLRWSERHAAVAWKEPKIYARGQFLTLLPDDWLVIGVFRDPVAVAQRRAFSDGDELLPTAQAVARFQLKLLSFLQKVPQTVGLVSYERFIVDPEPALQRLLEVIDAPRPPADLGQLRQQVLGQRAAYRLHTNPAPSERREP